MNIMKTLQAVHQKIPVCTPPFWAPTGHLQTIIASLLPTPRPAAPTQVFHIKTTDSNDLLHSSYWAGTLPVVVYLFHGLGGSIDSPYMKRFALIAQQLGYHVFLNNHRGCGEGAGLAQGPYHSGRWDDLSAIITHGRELFPSAHHVAIGVSLSANALLLLAAQEEVVKPDVAIAINAPIDLEKAAIRLKSGLNRIYDQHFLRSLKKYLVKNNNKNLEDYHLIFDLHDFDNIFTAPRGGFRNREDYYSTCSAKQYLHLIDIPTIIITCEDDPFVEVSDYKNAKYSNTTLVHIEKSGGHIGYLMGHGHGYKFWIDEVIEKYLASLV